MSRYDAALAQVNAFLEVDSAELSSEDMPEDPIGKFVAGTSARAVQKAGPADLQKVYDQAVDNCAARVIGFLQDEANQKFSENE